MKLPAGDRAVVSARGASRWDRGHPWIFRSDVSRRPEGPAGAALVEDPRGRVLGWALWSPTSEISLRLLDRDPDATLDSEWWRARLERAIRRRDPLQGAATAFRLVHGEGDGCPLLICDRYDRWLVVQLLSAGLESFRQEIVTSLLELTGAEGILARNDAAVRDREGLAREVVALYGSVPRQVTVIEHGVTYLAAPWDGQKTGAFLDQRENRALMGALAAGRALDCYAYQGTFALHMAARADHVTAVDASASALARARENAAITGTANISFVEGDAMAFLRAQATAGARYDTIVLDPPAFAKTRQALPDALRGYREINVRAMRLLAPGGLLLTASCSFHLGRATFLDMVTDAAADSGRRLTLREIRGQPLDHPEVLTIPESGYLKAALLEAMD